MGSAVLKAGTKRGRPSLEQAAQISASIVEAATALFLARGFAETTMDEIAARAGVPKSTIYKRHQDKAALLRFAIMARIEHWSSLSSARRDEMPDDLEARLKCYAAIVLTSPATRELQALARLTEGNWEGAREIAVAVHTASYGRMLDFLAAEILAYAVAGSVTDARSVGECLLAQLAGWLTTAPASECSTAEATAFAHRSVELLFHGRQRW